MTKKFLLLMMMLTLALFCIPESSNAAVNMYANPGFEEDADDRGARRH